MTCRMQNPPKVTSETPSSLFLRHRASACGTKRHALPSKASPKIYVTISLIAAPLNSAQTIPDRSFSVRHSGRSPWRPRGALFDDLIRGGEGRSDQEHK